MGDESRGCGVRQGAVSVDGHAPRRSACWLCCRSGCFRPTVLSLARVADARWGAVFAGAEVVVHRNTWRSVEHSCCRRARCRSSCWRSVPVDASSELCCGGCRRCVPSAGPHRVDHLPLFHSRHRCSPKKPSPHRESRARNTGCRIGQGRAMSSQLLVVGGGPVGLYASTAAATAGWSVTLVEARDGDGDKACGEGLMPNAVNCLRELGVHPSGVEFFGIRYVSADGKRQVESPLSDGHGIGVRRTELVRSLRAVADARGVIRVNGRVDRVRNGREGVSLTLSDGSHLTGEYVMGCDGLASTVRAELGLDEPVQEEPRYGI